MVEQPSPKRQVRGSSPFWRAWNQRQKQKQRQSQQQSCGEKCKLLLPLLLLLLLPLPLLLPLIPPGVFPLALLQSYKPGQGTWTRGMSAAGIAVLVVFGIFWIDSEIEAKANEYVRAGVALAILAFFAGISWWLLNKPRIVDFMIATESEMRKVNWPSKTEIKGSTAVVIIGTLLVTSILFVIDLGFVTLFTIIKIIDIGG